MQSKAAQRNAKQSRSKAKKHNNKANRKKTKNPKGGVGKLPGKQSKAKQRTGILLVGVALGYWGILRRGPASSKPSLGQGFARISFG